MFAKLYATIHQSPVLRAGVHRTVRALGLDLPTIGFAMGAIEKQVFRLRDGGKANIRMVNLGGAHFFKRGWGVLDYTGGRYRFLPGTVDWEHNLCSFAPLPFADGSIRIFYSSHCFEHLPRAFVEHTLREAFRALEPGGTIHITVPDFDSGYEAMRNGESALLDTVGEGATAEERFACYFCSGYLAKNTDLGDLRQRIAVESKDAILAWADSEVPESWSRKHQDHVSVWNFDRLQAALAAVGFTGVTRLAPGGSPHAELRGHGLSWAFDHRAPQASLFVEATRPVR